MIFGKKQKKIIDLSKARVIKKIIDKNKQLRKNIKKGQPKQKEVILEYY